MEQSDADRAAVAREVLTELEQWLREEEARPDDASFVAGYRDTFHPAPPAPETVTVGDDVYSRRGDTWYVGGFNIGLTLRHRELLDRIASDARVLKERDARIAELETQLQRALDGAVFHEKRAHHAEQERDDALRALEEKVAAGCSEGGTVQRNPTGEARYHADAERPGQPAVTSPAPASASEPRSAATPIPLGAVVEVEGEGGVESWVWDGKLWTSGGGVMPFEAVRWRALMLTALYRARHPVATRETVERVRKALLQAFRATRVGEDFTENCTRAALTAAGITLEES